MTRTIALAASVVAVVVGVASSPLHAQSALDGFDPGASSFVHALATQPDGRILVGGRFTTLGGGGTGTTPRSYIGRLHPDGSADSTFDPGANGTVLALAVPRERACRGFRGGEAPRRRLGAPRPRRSPR
jgi:Domain of unknown function (DUF5122) beta-propeller